MKDKEWSLKDKKDFETLRKILIIDMKRYCKVNFRSLDGGVLSYSDIHIERIKELINKRFGKNEIR